MMEMTISTERFDIISTGAVIIPADDYVEFAIENLRFRFNLIQNDNEAAQGTIQTNIEQDDQGECLIISLVNFSSSFFATPSQELQVAYLNNRELYLRFSVTSINRSNDSFDSLLFYTWMLTKQENNTNSNIEEDAAE
jgi:hypothetical protein